MEGHVIGVPYRNLLGTGTMRSSCSLDPCEPKVWIILRGAWRPSSPDPPPTLTMSYLWPAGILDYFRLVILILYES